MRILSYLALALCIAVLANVAASVGIPSYREQLRTIKESVFPTVGTDSEKSNTWSVEVLSWSIKSESGGNTVLGSEVVSGAQTIRVSHDPTPVPASNSGISAEITMPEAFMLRLIPKIVLEKTGKSRIFWLELTDIPYATYADKRYDMTAHIVDLEVEAFKARLPQKDQATLKETEAFFGRTIFYNAITDDRVRFFFPFSGQTIVIEIAARHYYDILKPLLLS